MPDACEITNVLVSTISTGPLRATIEIETARSIFKFELNEDLAHSLCTGLERFLTQRLPHETDMARRRR